MEFKRSFPSIITCEVIIIKINRKNERPIPEEVYPVIDNDLARDNIENDMTAADLADVDASRPENEDFGNI